MTDFTTIGKLLLLVGLGLVVLGVIIIILGRVTGIEQLPGDITIHTDGITFFFPIVGCLLLSIILTIILNLVIRFFR